MNLIAASFVEKKKKSPNDAAIRFIVYPFHHPKSKFFSPKDAALMNMMMTWEWTRASQWDRWTNGNTLQWLNVDSLHRKEAREEAGQKAKQAFEAKGMTKISTIVYCKWVAVIFHPSPFLIWTICSALLTPLTRLSSGNTQVAKNILSSVTFTTTWNYL